MSYKKIKEYINFLKSNLPEHPTAVNEIFSLPEKFRYEILSANYSSESLQKISDLIGYYLGLLRSVKITCVEDSINTESDTIFDADSNKKGISGIYKPIGLDHGEILLYKKEQYRYNNVIAILAHECVHNYLYMHKIHKSNEKENELFTDIATVYLGLGQILYYGYKPVTWLDNFWSNFSSSGHIKHTIRIGYITAGTIKKAIIISAKYRKWNRKEIISAFYLGGIE